MTSGHLIGSGLKVSGATLAVLLTALVAARASVVSAQVADPFPQGPAGRVQLVSSTITSRARTWSYQWPVKPFKHQHPVRAFLDDPRIGGHGGTSFHFGIDIAAPDGTAVYSVKAGTVFVDTPRAVSVVVLGQCRVFSYWHIVPAVRDGQWVSEHQLLGRIDKGWAHVHFAEKIHGAHVNPLRDGGLGPYVDRTPPSVAAISLHGAVLTAVAQDMPDPVVPGPWANEPVTPALLRWRIGNGAWKTAIDSRQFMLPNDRYGQVYTPATRQNHKGKPGRFSFYLDRSLHEAPARPLSVEVEVADTAGNTTLAQVLLTGGGSA